MVARGRLHGHSVTRKDDEIGNTRIACWPVFSEQETMSPATTTGKQCLSAAQLSRFERDGYLLIEGVLEPATVVQPVFAEYATVLDRLAHELQDRGEIASTYEDLEFGERLIRI